MKRNRAALIVVVAAIALLATACPAPRSPSKYGVNNSDAPAHMDLMRDAGFKWARYFVAWDDLETAEGWFDPATLAYWKSTFDAAVKRGFSIDVVFARDVPSWAWDKTQGRYCDKDKYKDLRQPGDQRYFHDFAKLAAEHFKPWVTAYEIYNEPEVDCRFPGNAAAFQKLVLIPGFRGLKEAQPDALILGPAVLVGDINDYYTYKDASGRWLTVPIDALSLHAYGTVTEVKDKMDTANKWVQCSPNPVRCVGDYWLTEYGFGEGTATPGTDAVDIAKKCDAQIWCKRAFYFSADYDPPGLPTYGLLNPSTGTPRSKYDKLKAYITSR